MYELLNRLGRNRGPWIGEQIQCKEESRGLVVGRLDELLARPCQRRFEPAAISANFLRVTSARFDEVAASGETVGTRQLEFVTPVPLGTSTVAVALIARIGADLVLGLDEDHLPAAQGFSGNSNLIVTPAWRLPRDIQGMDAARVWIGQRLANDYGIEIGDIWDLGGAYHPSPGLTPEIVHPMAIQVRSVTPRARELCWVPINEAVARRESLADGHLRIALSRVAHATTPG